MPVSYRIERASDLAFRLVKVTVTEVLDKKGKPAFNVQEEAVGTDDIKPIIIARLRAEAEKGAQ